MAVALLMAPLAGRAAETAGDPAMDLLDARTLAAESKLDDAVAKLDHALSAAPDDPYLRIERAKLLYQLGRLDAAAEDARLALAAAPEVPEILRTQGRIELARSNDHPEAAEAARAAWSALRRLDPRDLEALVSLGQLELAAGHAELASEALDEAAALRPGHPWIESLRSRAHSAAGDATSVEAGERAAIARSPGDLASRTELAQRLARQGRNAEAAALLEAAPAEQRARPELRQRIALQYFLAGDLNKSRELAKGLVAEDPEASPARQLLGRIELAEGNFAAAEAALTPIASESDSAVLDLLQALEAQGRYDAAASLLGERATAARQAGDAEAAETYDFELAKLWGRAGRWAEAESEASEVVASGVATLSEPALILRARALAQLGRLDDALKLLGPPSTQRPDRTLQRLDLLLAAGREPEAQKVAELLATEDSQSALAIATVYQGRGEFDRAIPLLERAHRADASSLPASFRLASSYERVGRVDDAERIFGELLAQAPSYPPALNYLGYLWIERSENLPRAVEMVREAVRLDPDNGAYVDSLGWGLYKLGETDAAIPYLERASRLLPDDATIFEHLGDARAARGDRDGALIAYQRASELSSPPSADLLRKLAKLQEGP